MKQEQYMQLIGKYPQITIEGYGVDMNYANGMSRRKYFALQRDELKGQQENFELCIDWLNKNPNLEGNWNAHYWKDRVQFFYKPSHPGYFHIPRGVFILAALYKRYDVTKMENSTDAWIGVPE